MDDINTVELNLLEAHFEKIREAYTNFKGRKRRFVIGRLEKISEEVKEVANVEFEGEIAKKIRIKEGFTLLGLAKICGLKSAQSIFNYEHDFSYPSLQRATSRKYLEWLKQQGYNPFNW
jgi:hypothetical protein